MAERASKSNQIQEEINSLPVPKEIQEIKDRLAANPTDVQLLMELGIACKKYQMDVRSAIEYYSIGLTYDPFNMLLYRHRGHAYINIRRYKEGAADLEMALRLDPVHWENWYHLALAYHLMGDFERAVPVYEKCLEVSTLKNQSILSRGTNDDLVIATTDWYCLTLMKLRRIDDFRRAAARVHKGMDVTDYSDGYFHRVLAYNGTSTVDEVYQLALQKDSHMFSTSVYGLAVYCEVVLGDKERALAIRKEITDKKSDLWSGFAELAAYEDLKNN